MDSNLKSRLQRIRDAGTSVAASAAKTPPQRNCSNNGNSAELSSWPLWKEAGFKVLKREITTELPFPSPDIFPRALAILIPDLAALGCLPSPGELLFFDLETTGLSGGAGTLAFLAAFGRFSYSGNPIDGSSINGSSGIFPSKLTITQYLLLDFPGEGEFIEQVAGEFCLKRGNDAEMRDAGSYEAGALPLVISFNGKCFDSQILRNRCLMNGINAPRYFHADLLHPARRLWKRLLPDCSQSTIETSILGLDREGDIPGAFAPEIWFSFLRDGENSNLLKICDHNVLDIKGLASLFLTLVEIAGDPHNSQKKIRCDEEGLAISWMRALKKTPLFFGDDEKETGEFLLERAAENGGPRASLFLALDLFKRGRSIEGSSIMLVLAGINSNSPNSKLTAGKDPPYFPVSIRTAALKSLAIDAEWRLKDYPLALKYVSSALEIGGITFSARRDLEKRQIRLIGKLKNINAE